MFKFWWFSDTSDQNELSPPFYSTIWDLSYRTFLAEDAFQREDVTFCLFFHRYLIYCGKIVKMGRSNLQTVKKARKCRFLLVNFWPFHLWVCDRFLKSANTFCYMMLSLNWHNTRFSFQWGERILRNSSSAGFNLKHHHQRYHR